MTARATGSATLSFGLVSIPVKLYAATTASEGVSFHLLHKTCGTRVKMQLYCPFDKEVITRADTVRGFEHQKDQFVRFEDDELAKLETEKTSRLEITEFVPAAAVDWVYLAGAQYLAPDKGGNHAYALLADSMARLDRMAIGRYHPRGKTQVVLLRSHNGGLVMHPLHFAASVRPFAEVAPSGAVAFKPGEQGLADQLVEQLSSPAFDPTRYRDEFQERLMEAVEQKVLGREVTVSPAEPQAQVIVLFEALKRSLAEKKPPSAAREPAAVESSPPEVSPPDQTPAREALPSLAKTRARRAAPKKKTAASS